MISKRARESSMCHDCNLCGQAIKRVRVFQLYWVVLDNVGLCLVGKIKLHKFYGLLCVFNYLWSCFTVINCLSSFQKLGYESEHGFVNFLLRAISI
jgi:hypothetical protein